MTSATRETGWTDLGACSASAEFRVTITVQEHSPWQAPADFSAETQEPSRISTGDAQQHLAASELQTRPSHAQESVARPKTLAKRANVIQAARRCRTRSTIRRIDVTPE